LREAELHQNKKDSTKTKLGGFQEFHIHPSQGESAMNIAQVREALLWCVILNIGLVTVWSILVLVAKGWLNGIILKWFRVSAERIGCDISPSGYPLSVRGTM